MKIQNVQNCTFSKWYTTFKDVTIKSRILPIPDDFLEYLLADGVVLPEGASPNCPGNDSDNDNTENEMTDWDKDVPECKAPTFPEFEEAIRSIIKSKFMGGKVFPKLNWSAPKDATWISFDRTLKCTCPSDVYLLLKSSDFITRDLTQPFLHCEDYNDGDKVPVQYELVLRRWHTLEPGTEFRCFVKENQLIGITQRDCGSCFPHINNEKSSIIADISAFHYHVIGDKFPDSSYVFDIYRKQQGKVYLIDFNPFGVVTDSLLFDWEELESYTSDTQLKSTSGESSQVPAFRYIDSSTGVQPDPYSQYAMPVDFKDLTSGEDAYKLVDFLKMKIQGQENDSSSSDDEPTVAIETTTVTNTTESHSKDFKQTSTSKS
ncbi:unnamed protein product [Owenia fusiformis]|uniref:Uncharacterized protein n=1 Tax=Owenia fusiformis TaxID=6347 RepID=A0A8J1XGT3_OWEFU|nr:unnamed protein product [Owenia fusiformis]